MKLLLLAILLCSSYLESEKMSVIVSCIMTICIKSDGLTTQYIVNDKIVKCHCGKDPVSITFVDDQAVGLCNEHFVSAISEKQEEQHD